MAHWLRTASLAVLVSVSLGLSGCGAEPDEALAFTASLPTRAAIHTEVHRRLTLARLEGIAASLADTDALPTLCRQAGEGRAESESALLVTSQMLRALREPPSHPSSFEEGLSAEPFRILRETAAGKQRLRVAAAVASIDAHRYLAVVRIVSHRAPERRGDRTVTKGQLEGELVLVDAEQTQPLCRSRIVATTSASMNAYGELDAEAFAEDLRMNFLRAIDAQLARAAGGMKLAPLDDVSRRRRLAAHGASAPSEGQP